MVIVYLQHFNHCTQLPSSGLFIGGNLSGGHHQVVLLAWISPTHTHSLSIRLSITSPRRSSKPHTDVDKFLLVGTMTPNQTIRWLTVLILLFISWNSLSNLICLCYFDNMSPFFPFLISLWKGLYSRLSKRLQLEN